MNATLPPPGSIWMNNSTGLPMRVVYSEDHDIIAHDAECADFHRRITSWRGTIKAFAAAFEPADPTIYPKTAGQ